MEGPSLDQELARDVARGVAAHSIKHQLHSIIAFKILAIRCSYSTKQTSVCDKTF